MKRLPFLAAMLLAAPIARAEDTSDLEGSLDEPVVTTASHSAKQTTASPGTTTTVTAEDLARFNITSLDQALDFLGLGVVTSNPLHQPDVGARGVLLTKDQGNHFLVLVNGHMMNEPLFGSAVFNRGLGVPFEMIDRIEVVIGPGSVLYGSNAMLGVINIVTKRPKDWKGVHTVAEYEPGKSYRGGIGAGTSFPLFGKTAGLTLQVEGYRMFGPAFQLGPQITGIDPIDQAPERFSRDPNAPRGVWGGPLWGKADKQHYAEVPAAMLRFVMGNLDVNVMASSYKRAFPFFDTRTRDAANYNEKGNYEYERSLRFDVKYRALLSPIVQLTTRLYGDSFEYIREGVDSRTGGCYFSGITTCVNRTLGAARWGGAEVQSSFDWFHNSLFVTLLGVDARRSFVEHQIDTMADGSLKPLRSSEEVIHTYDTTLGVYAQQEWNPARWLDVNGGVRVDAGEQYKPVANPRLAASVSPWRAGTLKVVYARAFRAPSWYERAATSLGLILARDLKPERVESFEASLEQRFKTQRIFFGVFRTEWTDMIEVYNLTPDEVRAAAARGEINNLRAIYFRQYRNVATIENYGFDAGFEGSLASSSLRYGLNLTSSLARRKDALTTRPLAVAPAFFGNARVAYALGGDLPTFAIAAHWLGKRPVDRAYDGGFTPMPFADPLIEVRGTISGRVPGIRGLSYRLTAQLANAKYGPYVVGPTQSYDPKLVAARNAVVDGAELVPIDRFRLTFGLRYDFGGDDHE